MAPSLGHPRPQAEDGRNIVPTLYAIALASLPPLSQAAPLRVARTLDVEVVETAPPSRPAAPHTHHELLVVTDDTGWASVQSHGPTELSLRARSSVDPRGAVLVEVDLHRTNRTDGDVDVATALPWSAGHRAPVSRIERDDGSIVELFVTTR